MADIVTGIRNVFSFKRVLVNLDEMTSVLAVSKKGAALEKGAWVRITRGPYRGDIAQVLNPNYDDTGSKAKLKIAPRLKLTGVSKVVFVCELIQQ